MSGADLAETAALQQLYRQHRHWLAGWLQRRTGCPENAADLAQDTFARILSSRQASRITEPRAFLATVAGRLLCNHYRRRDLERAYLEALAALPEPEVPSEEVRALALETLLELDRRLAQVPLRARRVFVLAQFEGLGQGEIARRLRISLASVKRDLARAAHCCYFGG